MYESLSDQAEKFVVKPPKSVDVPAVIITGALDDDIS